jgi:ketosteroid isomerase-like protein
MEQENTMSSSNEQTRQVLEHHMTAVDDGKIDAILSDYAEDAVLLTPKGARRGHAEIRPVLEWLLANIFTKGANFTMIQEAVEGEIAYIVWSAESERYRVPLATDTYLVRDGKIVVQTFAAKPEAKHP